MNRKGMLWPLLLAAAFALGVLAAQVQAASIFLPLVAKASTGQETPTPTGTVRVENVHCYSGVYWSFLRGELMNGTDHTVYARRVVAYLLDAAGLPVDSGSGSSMGPILLPGERTPFEISWFGSLPDWASYVVYVDWDPIDRLTIESVELTEGKYGGWQVTATVRNQLPVRVESLTIGTVLYAPSGQVIGYHDPPELHGPLAPGYTLVVTHTFDSWNWDASIEPVGCGAFAIP